MEQYRKIEEILNEISSIPFSIFYDKFTEINPFDYSRFEAFCVWVSLTEFNRERALLNVGYFDDSAEDYLKQFRS